MATVEQQQKAAAAENAAVLEVRKQQQLGKANEEVPSGYAAMPFGKLLRVKDYVEVRPSFRSRAGRMVEFEKIVKDYDPEHFTYAWPVKDNPETQAQIRTGVYIPLAKGDVTTFGELVSHIGTDDLVCWYRHILVKIPKRYADEMYEAPKAEALRRLVAVEESAVSDAVKLGAELRVDRHEGR